MTVTISKSLSIAFRDSAHTYGEGANLKVSVSFELPHSISLSELNSAVGRELEKWDHKHLGLDVKPKSYSAVEFAHEIKRQLENFQAQKVLLENGNGWSLEI